MIRAVPTWGRVAIVIIGVLLALLMLVWTFQRRLIYLPDRADVPPADTALPGAQDVTLLTDDGLRLGAWYLAAPAGDCRPTVLVAPGNGGNRAGRAPLARALHDRGYGVLLLDYRGYGGNPGSPSEAGLALDARAAYRFLTLEEGLAASELLYFGESLGGGVVTELATEFPPAGILLRSPFTDLAAAGAALYPFLPVSLLLRDRFPVLRNVQRLTALVVLPVPLTVVYGDADTVIPPAQSLAVAAAGQVASSGSGGSGGTGNTGNTATVLVRGADHNDAALVSGPQVLDALDALAQRAGCHSG